MTGAGIMLMSGDVPRGSVCTTDETSAIIEDLQFALGEGPCLDAHHGHLPVLEPDLASAGSVRWPAFTPPALEAGARAVFGYPMELGAVRLGALNLYRDAPGGLSGEQHANALAMAEIAAEAVLMLQSGSTDGALAADLESAADFQYVVHQAAGMVAAQLGVSVAVALIRLRAYAFGSGDPLRSVAEQVVGRALRFDDSDPPAGRTTREQGPRG